MNNIPLGNLESVNLRNIFRSEAGDFTPWLAHEDNLARLGETLEIELELESQEKNVGPFRADILCKDINSQNWVLIENQIERTDHNHLGQLMTYAAGLKAVTIIWIAGKFTDEHRAALDWLNEITEDGVNFFGVEIELWRIGDSPVAPKFNIVCKPNSWTHTVNQATKSIQSGELTETKKLQLAYWTDFDQFMKKRQSPVRPQRPYPQHWMNFAIGRSYFVLMAVTNTRERRIGVGLAMTGPNGKAHYYLLKNEKDEIEKQFGQSLEWRELPDGTESHIMLNKQDSDISVRNEWESHRKWMAETLENFTRVFKDRIKNLDADEYLPEVLE